MSTNTIEFSVSNMKCGGCVSAIEGALKGLVGVESFTVSLDDHKAVVTTSLAADEIAKTITDAGFPATLLD